MREVHRSGRDRKGLAGLQCHDPVFELDIEMPLEDQE